MNYKVLTLRDAATWNNLLKNLPTEYNDVYLTPEFLSLFQEKDNDIVRCFVCEDEHGCALYPFLMTKINDSFPTLTEELYDIQAPYGFNGMVSTNTAPTFLHKFSTTFETFCRDEKIVAELVRFNPILKNQTFMPHLTTTNVLDNVSIDLTHGYDFIWRNSFEGKVRKAVRKAETHHLAFEHYRGSNVPDDKWTWFKKLYRETMKRNDARDYYYFSDAFFSALPQALPDNSIIAFACHQGNPVSTQLVLFKGKVAYGYLGGTSSEAYNVSPNVYLFNKLVGILCELGLDYYSLGGGVTRHDSLYQYKKSFSRIASDQPICLGHKIHDEIIYNKIIAEWKQKFPHLEHRYQNYILKYRYTS